MKNYANYTDKVVQDAIYNINNVSLTGSVSNEDLYRIEKTNHHLLPKGSNWRTVHRETNAALMNAGFERHEYGFYYLGDYKDIQ